MKKFQFVFIALVLLSINNYNCKSQTVSDYKITNRFYLEGEGSWDYLIVDTASERLFISHSTVTQVMDIKTGKLIHTIEDTKGVHGIALAYDLNKGFISNGKDSSVTVFNLKTFEVLIKIPVTGKNPDAILYDEFTHKVFTFNGRSSNATVIDAKTNTVIATIPLEGKPEFAVADGYGKIYVNIEDKSDLCCINSDKMTVEKYWSLAPGKEPSGLAFDAKNHYLFSACDNKLMIISDALTGTVLKKLSIGESVDGAAFDAPTNTAFSSNGDGTVTVIQEKPKDDFEVVSTVTTEKWARTIALDCKTHKLYLPTKEVDETSVKYKDAHPGSLPGKFVILEISK
ncbi:MAG: YncE family protein [Bacteroidota bacterium]